MVLISFKSYVTGSTRSVFASLEIVFFFQAVRFALKFTDEGYEAKRKMSARPHRMSEITLKTTIHPIPQGSAFFIFSNTNR
jgi:hypothetical protein